MSNNFDRAIQTLVTYFGVGSGHNRLVEVKVINNA